MLGLSEAKLKRSKAALTHLTRALALGVGDESNLRPVALFIQANLYLEQGAFGLAQQSLDTLARERGTADEELLIALGRAVIGLRPEEAPLSSEMHDLLTMAGQAEMFAANRQTAAAQQAYGDLVKRFPKTHNVQFAYGRFLLVNHLDEQAVNAFEQELANSPQHLLARLGIAGALLRTDPARALRYAAEAVKLAPKLGEAHFLLGAAMLSNDKPAAAIQELEIAEKLSPKDARIYFQLAKGYARMHRNADAARARAEFEKLNAAQEQ